MKAFLYYLHVMKGGVRGLCQNILQTLAYYDVSITVVLTTQEQISHTYKNRFKTASELTGAIDERNTTSQSPSESLSYGSVYLPPRIEDADLENTTEKVPTSLSQQAKQILSRSEPDVTEKIAESGIEEGTLELDSRPKRNVSRVDYHALHTGNSVGGKYGLVTTPVMSAMNKELESLEQKGTWEVVKHNPKQNVISGGGFTH
ncbi:hypothetical protein SeMB42_g02915 [Synchytrium endobioticum]|uniref:Uncharacterized protein n=1 Tax=Synchytrium endobioticum TaxID=286115 RepID=A0A507DB12_9FUNG|nr:hypothetical protein SeMB42_g02915 [Synchytrium endobioticum]